MSEHKLFSEKLTELVELLSASTSIDRQAIKIFLNEVVVSPGIVDSISHGKKPSEIFPHVGRWFAFWRRCNSWTQAEIARRKGCHYHLVSFFENNSHTGKTYPDILSWMEAYQISLDHFEQAGYSLESFHEMFPRRVDASSSVGRCLYKFRVERGMSQAEVAKALADESEFQQLDLSSVQPRISQLELGRQAFVGVKKIVVRLIVVDVLHRTEEDFYNETEILFEDLE